jgi:DNA-binding transcriptional LysR family regulator
MSPPDLLHLRAFLAVAQRRSFRGAAAALNVSPSALSQAVRTLEQYLGVPLLQRTTRSVTPTEVGQQLLMQLTPVLSDLERVLQNASQRADTRPDQVRGTLRLNMPRSAASLWLSGWVSAFVAAHPGIHLEVVSSDVRADIVRDGFDAGVRFPESLEQDMVALPVGPMQRFVVVAAPALAQATGNPQTPSDLERLPCVAQRFSNGALYRWQFRRGDEVQAIRVSGRLTLDDQPLIVQAALGGVGWAYVYETLAAPYLAAGQLVQALAEWCPAEPGFQLYYPSRQQVSPPLRALIAWLRQESMGPAGWRDADLRPISR